MTAASAAGCWLDDHPHESGHSVKARLRLAPHQGHRQSLIEPPVNGTPAMRAEVASAHIDPLPSVPCAGRRDSWLRFRFRSSRRVRQAEVGPPFERSAPAAAALSDPRVTIGAPGEEGSCRPGAR